MIGMIYAQSANGVLGVGGKIPWSFRGDLRRFKRMTSGSTVIMGRKTWESIGKPLTGRDNIVVTSQHHRLKFGWIEKDGRIPASLYFVESVDRALKIARVEKKPIWFIGGARIYEAAMAHVEVIDRTWVPVHVELPPCEFCGHRYGEHIPASKLCLDGCKCESYQGDVALAPVVDPVIFVTQGMVQHEDEPELRREVLLNSLKPEAEEPYQDEANRNLHELGIMSRRARWS